MEAISHELFTSLANAPSPAKKRYALHLCLLRELSKIYKEDWHEDISDKSLFDKTI